MKPLTNKEIRDAEDAVNNFNEGDLLGRNTKILRDGETYQIRIGDALRVQFKFQEDGEKEIVDIFNKVGYEKYR